MSKLAKESRLQIPRMSPWEKLHFWSSWGQEEGELEVLAFILEVEN